MKVVIEKDGKKRELTDGCKIYGTKEDLLLLYGNFKENLTQITNIPSGELGCITVGSINVKPEKIKDTVAWG